MNRKRKKKHSIKPLNGDVANKKMKSPLTWQQTVKNTIYLQMINSVYLFEAFYSLWIYTTLLIQSDFNQFQHNSNYFGDMDLGRVIFIGLKKFDKFVNNLIKNLS